MPQSQSAMQQQGYQMDRPAGMPPAAAPPVYSAPALGDAGMARRAAVALGLTLPFIGLPVGWIFMMLEDRQKQAVGRWCANWSLLGFIIHLILTVFLFQQSGPILMRLLLPIVQAAGHRNSAGSDGTPDIQ